MVFTGTGFQSKPQPPCQLSPCYFPLSSPIAGIQLISIHIIPKRKFLSRGGFTSKMTSKKLQGDEDDTISESHETLQFVIPPI